MYQIIPTFTLEEYLALDAASEHKWEYEDGYVYCLAGSTNAHQSIGINGSASSIALMPRKLPFLCWDKRLRLPTSIAIPVWLLKTPQNQTSETHRGITTHPER